MAGKENPQPHLNPKDTQFFKRFDSDTNYRFSLVDLSKQIEHFEKRKLGRTIDALFYEEKEDGIEIVETEKVGYILPSKVNDEGKVTRSVVVLNNGFLMVTEPRSHKEKHIKQYQEFYPNTYPFEIDLPYERKDESMNDIPNVLEGYLKIVKSSNNESHVPKILEELDQATVTAWNLKESKGRGLRNSAKGAVTIFDGFLKEYDKQSPGDTDFPPKDVPPQQPTA